MRGGQSARPNTETHVSGVSWHSHRITKRFRPLISYNEHKYVEHGDNRSCTARPGQANPRPRPEVLTQWPQTCRELSRLVATVRIYISALIAECFRFGCHKKMAPKIKHKREIKVSLRVSCQHQLCHARYYIYTYIVYTSIVCMYVCTELCLSWPGYCARRFLLKFSIIACDLLAQNVPGNCNLLCGHLGTHTPAHTLAHRQACLLPYIFIWLTLSIIAGITRGPNKLVAQLKCKTNKQQTYRCCRHKETLVYECVCEYE